MKQLLQKSAAIMMLFLAGNADVATAQTWQWGKRGGGPFNGANVDPTEKVVDMATDKNGNIYTLSILSASGSPNVDGNAVTGYGSKDILVSSFSCGGTYRWSKVIGGTADDIPGSIGTDTVGHVYITGRTINTGQTHFSNDSIIAATNDKTIFLVQYDTLGTFKWLRQPGSDTGTFVSHAYNTSFDMSVAGNGDVYWYAMLMPGLVSGGNGWAVTAKNGYMLQYNAAGAMTGHTDIDMNIGNAAFSYLHFNRTSGGKFIFAATRNFSVSGNVFTVNGQTMTHTLFMGGFSATGQYLWKKEDNSTIANAAFYSKPVIDAQDYIYVGGIASAGDIFNGYTFTNWVNTIPYSAAFISKLDINGGHLWTKNAGANTSTLFNSVALKGSNEVWLSGTAASVWWDSTHKIQLPTNGGYCIYAARFNNQGTILGLDSVKGSAGSQNWTHASATDRNGNLYIGGEFDGDLYVNGQTISKLGGSTDFFVTKLGNPCNCVTPTAAFTKSISVRTVNLTYNGTTTGVDSVVWNYGNGVKATKTGAAMSTAFTYTFPANGTYNVCVTAYGTCGSNQNCQSVTVVGVGIGNTTLDNVKVYPNPANDFVIIEGAAEGTTATLLNLVGQEVAGASSLSSKQSLSLASLPSGTYLLVLTGKDGARSTTRIIKQ